MNEPTAQFITAATQDLSEQTEEKQNAELMLHGHVHCYGEGGITEATAQMNRPQNFSQWMRRVFCLIVVVFCFSVTGWQASSLHTSPRNLLQPSNIFYGDDQSLVQRNLTAHQRMVLYGEHRSEKPDNRMYALWQTEPNNPIYYHAYAEACLDDYYHPELPEDFIEYGAKIDPGNGWYAMLESAVLSEQAVEKNYSGSSSPWKYNVLSEPKMKQALELAHQAAAADGIHSHRAELWMERASYLPTDLDFATRIQPLAYAASQSTASCMKITDLARLISAEAERCSREKDAAALKKLIQTWRKIGAELVDDSNDLITLLVARAFYYTCSKPLADAAADCDMPEAESELRTIYQALEDEKKQRSLRSSMPGSVAEKNATLFTQKAGILHKLSMSATDNQLQNPPALTDDILRPGRLTDHAFTVRVLTTIACFIFLFVAATAWLVRYRNPKPVRLSSARLARVLRPMDWVWILLLGLLLPVLYYQIINRFTPLGAREFSVLFTEFTTPAGQFTACVMLVLIALPTVARMRLIKRLPALGCKVSLLHWLAVGCCVVAIPFAGVAPLFPEDMEILLMAFAGLLALVQILFFWWIFQALFFGGEDILRRAIVQRFMIPAYATAALLFIFLAPIYQAEEKKHIANDTVLRMNPESPCLTDHEYRITLLLKEETKALLKLDGSD